MSTFIWGKIKLNKKIIKNNYQRKNILVFFSDEKNDLFQSDLEENEINFNYFFACSTITRSSIFYNFSSENSYNIRI